MPSPKVSLSAPHLNQRGDGDCLAVCAAMALACLGRIPDYDQLLLWLKIRPHGAPARNILALAEHADLNVRVVYSTTDITGLETLLQQGFPVIVFVRTDQLPYWSYGADHALVVVGCDDASIYVNDPDQPKPSIAVSRGDFELAWLERDCHYAVVLPR